MKFDRNLPSIDLLKLAIDNDVARVEWENSDHDDALDIDLDKGIDDDGYTIDGGMLADDVRRLQNGTMSSMACIIEVREPKCAHCDLTPGWNVVTSLSCIWIANHGDCEPYEVELADEARDEIIAALERI